MATYKLLDSYTVGAGGASSITFSNIPQIYTDLKVVVSDRTSRGGGVNDAIGLAFNGSSSNFTARRGYASNGGTASDNEPNYPVIDVASGAQANTFANIEYYIPDYTKSTYKIFMGDGAGENNSGESYRTIATSLWSQTTAITSITINYQNASGFLQYTTVYLYGIWADSSTGTPSAPTIGTATATSDSTATVAFTPAGTGSTASAFQATSTPGSITAIGTSSPITVTGLTGSTSYTFKVAGINPIGTGLESSASNQITTSASPGYVAIATANASGSSTIHFNAIPQTYKHLILRFSLSFSGGGDSSFRFYLNGDTGNNYFWHDIYFDGSPHNYYTGNTDNIFITNHYQGNSNYPSAGYLDIMNYTSGQKKSVRVMAGTGTANADGGSIGSGLWNSTSAITSISLLCKGSYVFANGKVGLFGIK